MTNWFSVGETVIIQNSEVAELNNVEGVIFKTLKPNLVHFCRISGRWCKNVSVEEVYLLDKPFKNPNSNTELSFKKSSLRKKYQPSTDSFRVMIRKLKSGETI